MGVDVGSAAWAAWQAALADTEPVLEAGRPLRWRRGRVLVAARPEAGREVAIELEAASALEVWAAARATSPSAVGALATGDATFDEAVLIAGDPRVLAVLDAPTRAALKGLVVQRRGRIDGGVLRLDATATAALATDAIAPALATLGDLAARLDRALEAFDAELRHLLGASPGAPVPASIARAFPDHPAVVSAAANAVAARATAPGASAAALLRLVEDPRAPATDRLRAAREVLARLPEAAAQAAPLLARLLRAPSLPGVLRGAAVDRLLRDGSLAALGEAPADAWRDRVATVVEVMRRSDAARDAGARLLARADDAAMTALAALGADDLAFVAAALAALGAGDAAIELLVRAAAAIPSDGTLVAVVQALCALGADLGRVFAALDEPAFDHAASALPRLAAALSDPLPVLLALDEHVSDAPARAALLSALGRHGDARAPDALVAALSSRRDEVVDAAIAALAEVGSAAALKPLERHAEGLFKDRARKLAARAAIDRIRERATALAGGVSVASDDRGGLTVARSPLDPAVDRPPRR